MKTLATLLDEYHLLMRSRNFSYTTMLVRCSNARAFLRWLETGARVRTPDRLREEHLRKWQLALSRRCARNGLPLRPRAVNKQLESVRAFAEYLRQEGLVPTRLPEALVYVRVPQTLPRVLPHADIRRMLEGMETASAAGFRNRTMLELLYSSGLRAAELLGMNIADIDFAQATVLIRGKGRKERIVPVGETAKRFIESYLRAVRPSLRPPPGEDAVFLGSGGRRLRYHTLRRIIVTIAAEAGLKGKLTAHVFRRSCATELVRGNANLYHISRLLGHESLDTLQHYAKLDVSDLRKTHHRTHPREKDEQARGR